MVGRHSWRTSKRIWLAMPDPHRVDSASKIIHASADAVYAAFADGEAWCRWLPPEGMTCEMEQFDFREGGRFSLALVYEDDSIAGKSGKNRDFTRGEFVELVPGIRMVTAIEFESDDPAFSGTMHMAWDLEETGSGTIVSIAATDVPEGIAPEDHAMGMNSTLANLASVVETQE